MKQPPWVLVHLVHSSEGGTPCAARAVSMPPVRAPTVLRGSVQDLPRTIGPELRRAGALRPQAEELGVRGRCPLRVLPGAQPRPRRQGCRVSETPALDVLPLLLAPFCHCWLEAGLPVWWARREPLLLALLAAQLKELPATQAHTPPGRLALRHLRTPSLANSSARRRQWAAAAGVACMGGPWACCC